MKKESPQLLCLTATRNYGWVTRAFLEANLQWADFVIVVDQMSSDGTREICAEYKNVILVDNTDLSYSERKRSELAINKARSLTQFSTSRILISLAIDEVLPANWMKTNDGKKILESKPGDMFILNWAHILPDKRHYRYDTGGIMYRILNDDGVTPYDSDGLEMHTYCLPYIMDGKEYYVHDFPIIHFDLYNVTFQKVKQWYYYQMVDYDLNHRASVKLSRYYRRMIDNDVTDKDSIVDPSWFEWDFNIFNLIDLNEDIFLYKEIKDFIEKKGAKYYSVLDIWDKELLDHIKMKDPRTIFYKMIHMYLHVTYKIKDTFPVRVIDKVLNLLRI